MGEEKIRIDARGLKDPEPLRLLRDALQGEESVGKEIVMLVDSRDDVKKVKTFGGFTGCLLDPVEKGDHWEVHITPMCNCG